jgi:glycosyltransferase involved in cell wall biosynthesis
MGRTTEFGELINSLEKQTFKDFELIVSDQNDDERLAPYLRGKSFPITRLRSYPGAAHARNAGIPYAVGSIITFPDDDCTYPTDLLEKLDSYFRDNSGLNVVCVRSCATPSEKTETRFDATSGEIDRYNIWARSVEFTIFVESVWLKKVQFDPDMGVGAFTPWQAEEGPDLLIRLQEQGATTRYEASLFIVHEQAYRTYDEKALTRAYKYACGRGYFLRKHGYPFWFIAYTCAKSLMGCFYQLARFNRPAAHYYWAYFSGKAMASSGVLSRWLLLPRHAAKAQPEDPYRPPVMLERIQS